MSDCCNFFFSKLLFANNRSRNKVDLLGSPMPDTPRSSMRYRHRQKLADKLEFEESTRNLLLDNTTTTENRHYNNCLSNIYTGDDAEEELKNKYVMRDVLGVGSTSTCYRCIHRGSRQHFACKVIDKKVIESRFKGMLAQFQVEIEALQQLRHPNIIHLNDVFMSNSKIFIVMELMEGGEMFDYIVEKGTLTEEEASYFVRQVTSALVYMHANGIVHRDLKPENLLLTHRPRSALDKPQVKIIDFGLSKNMDGPVARSFLGTRGYLAPEMLQRRDYSKSVDIWALGVIVFVLLCGCLPFDDDSQSVPTDEVVNKRFYLRFPKWAKNLSDSAKDLLSHLLDINPMTRFTAEQAFNHPWVRGASARSNIILESPRYISPMRASVPTSAATTTATVGESLPPDRLAAIRANAESQITEQTAVQKPQREASI